MTILERIGHFLDRENEDKYRYFKDKGYSKREIPDLLARHIDLKEILSLAARRWDGGYVMACLPISFVFGMLCMFSYFFSKNWKKIGKMAAEQQGRL